MRSLLPIVAVLLCLSDHAHAAGTPDVTSLKADAERGDPNAQAKLGWLYKSGKDVKQDIAEAFKWYQMAADRGEWVSQCVIGNMYETGQNGAKQDWQEAYFWYALADKISNRPVVCKPWQKHTYEAVTHLEPTQLSAVETKIAQWKPLNGGVIKWVRDEAESGNAGAQHNLSWMLENGTDGAERDYKEAYFWRSILAAKAHDNSPELLHDAKELNSEQLDEVQKRVRSWLLKHSYAPQPLVIGPGDN
jgi:TPR repeat protein